MTSSGRVLDGQPSPALGGLRPWEAGPNVGMGPNEALTYVGQGKPASPTKSQKITRYHKHVEVNVLSFGCLKCDSLHFWDVKARLHLGNNLYPVHP